MFNLTIVIGFLFAGLTYGQTTTPRPVNQTPPRTLNLPPSSLTPLNSPSNIRPVQMNTKDGPLPPMRGKEFAQGNTNSSKINAEELLEYQIRLEVPGPELLYRLDSEMSLMERMRQEGKSKPQPEMVQFPEKAILSNVAYTGRTLPPNAIYVEPRFVTHHRLYFEEKNTERYGWDLGYIQPIVSTAYFYRDVLFLPHNIVSHPHRRYDTSAGKCLPGDSVPYLIYPPEFTAVGSLAEAGVIIGLFGIFP